MIIITKYQKGMSQIFINILISGYNNKLFIEHIYSYLRATR